jgi:hypothetical protein
MGHTELNYLETIKTKRELDCLIRDLLSKKKDGFVFRGHASPKWKLKPKFFRDEEILKSWDCYGLSTEDIEKNWFENEKTLSALGLCLGGGSWLTKANYQDIQIIYKGKSIPLKRLLWSYIDIMKYNHNLCQCVSDKRHCYTGEYLENIKSRPTETWKSFDTFLSLLSEIIYIIERRDINSEKLLNNPKISNDLTGYDETLPQHYNAVTSALDWTKTPYIALYFASSDFIDICSSRIITDHRDTHITLFSYKQLKNDNDISVTLKNPDKKIKNDRAEKQEALFTFMPKARSFYLMNGLWPEIEKDYNDLIGEEFLLEKHIISLNNNTITYIQAELENKGINKLSMGLSERTIILEKAVEIYCEDLLH